MKQTVSYLIPKSEGKNITAKQKHCGFDLCHKKYKYLANPQLLDKVFSNQVPKFESIHKVDRPRHLDDDDTMHTTQCMMCKETFLLLVENPVCTTCRGVY
jgi:hypothetical protein